ncbi:MAG: Cdc6/Cdc18 family protein [Candidatus Bathyarchaeia archaeon]
MSVFRNRESLSPHYPIEAHWDEVPHRTEQVRYLWNFYGDILDRGGESYLRRLQIIGPAGSGKTCTLKFFGDRFEAKAKGRGIDLIHVYINLKLGTGRKVILYRNLLKKVEPSLVSASFSAGELVRVLVDYLQESGRRVLLTVDEIDYYVRHYRDEGVVYDLTRLNELTLGRPCGVVGVTFLARDRGFHDLLDVAELSTLGRAFVPFKPYTSEQVYDILERRAREAFYPGSYSSEVLELIADITANPKIKGDMRYALDILLYSGNLAENQGADQILPEHVRRVYGEIHHLITTEDILSLPDRDKIVLLGVVRALMSRRSSYASLREIKGMVGSSARSMG